MKKYSQITFVYISRYSVFGEKQVQSFMFVMANAYGPTFISLCSGVL